MKSICACSEWLGAVFLFTLYFGMGDNTGQDQGTSWKSLCPLPDNTVDARM